MSSAVMCSAVMSGRHGRGAILLVRVLERLAHELLHHLRRVLHQLRRLELREDAHRRQSHIRIRILEPVGKTGRRGEHLHAARAQTRSTYLWTSTDAIKRNQAQPSAIKRNQAESSAITIPLDHNGRIVDDRRRLQLGEQLHCRQAHLRDTALW
jgi:hypothetical protein